MRSSAVSCETKKVSFMNPLKNPTEISGMLGESVTMRKLNGRVVIKNRPRRKVVADPTEKQLVVFRKFKEAAQWAKKQIAKPDVDALYAARVTDKVKSDPSPSSF